jgi:eukaryotic-like serine/threonine-protein kinase
MPNPILLQNLEFETFIIDRRGEIVNRKLLQSKQFSQDLGSGVQLEMVAIPTGTFQMGSPAHIGDEDEHPFHLVTIPSFFIGKFPLTQAQWLAVMGKPLYYRFKGADKPVENVSWNDAMKFCMRLAQKTGRSFRLPSESEWEYACRAGSSTPFSYGETLTTDYANYCGEHIFASEPAGVYRHTTTPVGSLPPNAFGLYDMHGNVWEWCADAWHPDYSGAPVDGSARISAASPILRILRGGSWHEVPGVCRSAARLKLAPDERDDMFGFRLALSGFIS